MLFRESYVCHGVITHKIIDSIPAMRWNAAHSSCFEGGRLRSLRNQSPNYVAFPHPQSRKDHGRNEDVSRLEGVVREFVERAVDIAEDWNAKEEVNPAENCAGQASVHDIGCVGGCVHGVTPLKLMWFCLASIGLKVGLSRRCMFHPSSWLPTQAKTA